MCLFFALQPAGASTPGWLRGATGIGTTTHGNLRGGSGGGRAIFPGGRVVQIRPWQHCVPAFLWVAFSRCGTVRRVVWLCLLWVWLPPLCAVLALFPAASALPGVPVFALQRRARQQLQQRQRRVAAAVAAGVPVCSRLRSVVVLPLLVCLVRVAWLECLLVFLRYGRGERDSARVVCAVGVVCGTGGGARGGSSSALLPCCLRCCLAACVCLAACRGVSFACWAAAAGRSSTAVYGCCPGPVATTNGGFG